MKRVFIIIATLIAVSTLSAQDKKSEIVKKGWSFGPLPIVAFDADKGFQYGALLNLYDFGKGENYPNYNQKFYFETSFYTKGSQVYTISYDAKHLIPNVRFSSAISYTNDNAMDFYGFNGYSSYYDSERVKQGKEDPTMSFYTPFYRVNYKNLFFKADFTGQIIPNLYWEAGYHFSYVNKTTIDYDKINKNKEAAKQFTEPTLYDYYKAWGILPASEATGGNVSALLVGMMYDTRDKEGAPSKGIWAEGHLIAAPKFLGTSSPYYRYSLTFRQYLPIIKNNTLTFAYRLNYQGTIGKTAPWYMLSYMTVMGEGYDKDGIGGYRTTRGLMRGRIQALGVGFYNVELRWRFVRFSLFKQNIALGLSAFHDGAITLQPYDMSFKGYLVDYPSYATYIDKAKPFLSASGKDKMHLSVGGGLRFIMNENFIVAVEYGLPLNNQDGNGSLYINTGYLF